jgi:hypothetical protein
LECEEWPGLPVWWLRAVPSGSGKTSEMGGRRLFVWWAGTWWMCEDWERLEGALATWRDRGTLRRPVKVWLMGADWMMRSLANCVCVGGAMERPGGGPLRRDVRGVLRGRPKAPVLSEVRGASSSEGAFVPCFWRASII